MAAKSIKQKVEKVTTSQSENVAAGAVEQVEKVDKQSLPLGGKSAPKTIAGSKYALSAEKRNVFGRKLKPLRRAGILPGNISGKHIKSFSVQVSALEFGKVYDTAGETGLVSLAIEGGLHPVLIHEIHWDPVYGKPLHVDFLEVNLSEKVEATVPVEIIGESPAVRAEEGVLVQQVHEVQVEALPTDLPEKIEVDISGLEKVDDHITVSQLSVDKSKVEIKEDDPERIVVSIAEPAKEEVIEEVPAAEGVEAPVEGEAPAEGGEAPEAEKVEEKSEE